MGTWGANLYEDDLALDIRDRFDELKKGKTVREITNELIDEHVNELDDLYCAPTFWFALADTQWNLGRLLPEVKEQALAWIEKGGDLVIWKEENPTLAIIRENVLSELRQKLNSPQPPEKKICKYRLYKDKWNVGDVYAYQLESDFAKEKGLQGRYFLFQKIDEDMWYPGHIIPIVYVKITDDNYLPTCVEDFNKLEYVQTSSGKFDLMAEEFRPKEKDLTKEEFEKKVDEMKAGLRFDEYGYLPNFRAKLLNTSKRVIPTKLIYIDNYVGTVPPKIEYIRKNKISIPALSWVKFNKTIEIDLLERYFNFNKRQAKIYQTI